MRLDHKLMPGDSLEGLCRPMTDVILDHEPAEQHRQQHADTREDKMVRSPAQDFLEGIVKPSLNQ